MSSFIKFHLEFLSMESKRLLRQTDSWFVTNCNGSFLCCFQHGEAFPFENVGMLVVSPWPVKIEDSGLT